MSVLKIKDALGNWIKILTIKGDTGATGAQGAQGIPGVSPTVTVTDITGGHRITITDAEHPGGISFDVMDGSDADAPVRDVTFNESSLVNNKIANLPMAANGSFGLVRPTNTYGVVVNAGNYIGLRAATDAQVKAGQSVYAVTLPNQYSNLIYYALAKLAGADMASLTGETVGTYPETQKSAIHEMLSGSISVTGATPTINALPGLRYICGEVSTLTVNLPASGCVDITFESGSTPTVLTVVPASGQSVTFPAWFDDENLEADTVYEMSFADGYGAVMSWQA